MAVSRQLNSSNVNRFGQLGRTLFFASLVPVPMCGIATGCILATVSGDPWRAAHVRIRYALFALAYFFTIMAALSLSTNFLEVVNRAQLGRRRYTTTATSLPISNDTAPEIGVSYSAAALAIALVSSLATGILLVASLNPALTSLLFLAVMPVVGGSFILASKRINTALIRVLPLVSSQGDNRIENISSRMNESEHETNVFPHRERSQVQFPTPTLSLRPQPAPTRVQVLAEQVQKVTHGVGIRCVAISCSGIAFGLCRPSPSPLYAQQNSLPPWLSGQIAYFLLATTIIEFSVFIAANVRFWANRRSNENSATGNSLPRFTLRMLALTRLRTRLSTIAERGESSCSSLANPPFRIHEVSLGDKTPTSLPVNGDVAPQQSFVEEIR